MGLIIGQMPRLPDELVNNSWVKTIEISNQGGSQQDDVFGEKLEGLKPGQILDHVDISSAIPLDPLFGKNIEYDLDSSFVVKGRQDFVVFSGGHASEKAEGLAAQMTEYPVGLTFSLDGFSMEQLAELVGGIGKDVDSAFAAGEISEQEYDALNKGLTAYTEFMTDKAEKEKASFAVMKQTAAETRAAIQSGASEKEMFDYAELVREKWQEKIDKYLDENGYDRTALDQMIAAVRSGNILSFQAMA